MAAAGGNKGRIKKGVAVFKDVRVTADVAGSYSLRVQSASRKVAVSEAVLQLVMAPQNIVRDLHIELSPALLEGGCPAGTSSSLHVGLLTENELPLPDDVAVGSLTLRVTPPGKQSSARVCVWRGGGGVPPPGAAAACQGRSLALSLHCVGGGRADVVTLTLAPPEDGDSLLTEEGNYCFPLTDLGVAGSYSAGARRWWRSAPLPPPPCGVPVR